jgi:hypothetical protein
MGSNHQLEHIRNNVKRNFHVHKSPLARRGAMGESAPKGRMWLFVQHTQETTFETG